MSRRRVLPNDGSYPHRATSARLAELVPNPFAEEGS